MSESKKHYLHPKKQSCGYKMTIEHFDLILVELDRVNENSIIEVVSLITLINFDNQLQINDGTNNSNNNKTHSVYLHKMRIY